MGVYKLSPSDFAYLWEDCKRCFWLKVHHGIRQPSIAMAAIFKRIESLQIDLYDGKSVNAMCPTLPAGTLRCGEVWVESEVIYPVSGMSGCYIFGKLDSLIEFEDGSWGILDFKTTESKSEKIPKYARQLHSYALSLEYPSSKPLSMKSVPPRKSPISRLGIFCFEPKRLSQPTPQTHAYEGDAIWIEIEKNDGAFRSYLGEVIRLLGQPMPPLNPECPWCRYQTTIASLELGSGNPPAVSEYPLCPACGSPMVRKTGKRGPFLSCQRYPECRGTRDIPSA
jgi:hypothetical protein